MRVFPEPIIPTVQMNGTSQEHLVNVHAEVCNALTALIEAMKLVAPNGRDFQHNPPLFEIAAGHHRQRMEAAADLLEDYEAMMIGVISQ